jgi:5-methylcytosine-specific restriction endonuclease McrA
MQNYRETLKQLIANAQELHRLERSISLRSIELIGKLEALRVAPNVGMSVKAFAVHIGLTEDQYLKRSAAARVLWHIPEAKPLLEKGEISVSHLAMIAGKITRANQKLILDNIKGKSLRESKLFISRVTSCGNLRPGEETIELKITLTKSQLALLDRAREVLAAAAQVPSDAEVLVKALDDLLTKRDPLRKAERAAARQESRDRLVLDQGEQTPAPPVQTNSPDPAAAKQHPRANAQGWHHKTATRYIPAAVRHEVWRRDGGRCTHVFQSGERCDQRMMLELDHQQLYCRGGAHSADNLQLKCRLHNHFGAAQALGPEWYQDRLVSKSRFAIS